MRLADIAAEDLRDWEIPTREAVNVYWAFQRNLTSTREFRVPNRYVYGILPQGGMLMYVDPEERWVWAEVPALKHSWLTAKQVRAYPQPADSEVIPAWLRAANRNFPTYSGGDTDPQPPLLVRRRLSADEVVAMLDEILPPAAEYPLAEQLAAILRSGGWTPADLQLSWWEVVTRDDAAALAAHPPHWWSTHGWRWTFPVGNAVPPLPARVLTDLLERGVRADLAERCIWYGITDVDQISALRPPTIPDDATRIAYHDLYPSFDVDPVAARQTLNRYPERWLRPVEVASGVQPLHIGNAWSGDPAHFVAWSDGQLTHGHVSSPASVPDGDPSVTWQRGHREFEATQHLLLSILAAENETEIDADVWMLWRGAARTRADVIDTVCNDLPIGAYQTAERELTLTRHTVHHADGREHSIWQVTEQIKITVSPRRPFAGTHAHTRWHTLHTSAEAAQEMFATVNDGLPPLETVEEAAERAAMTRDAVAQAISRARKARREQFAASARSLTPPQPVDGPPEPVLVGQVKWYEPRSFQNWLHNRVGHGPGRGHRRS